MKKELIHSAKKCGGLFTVEYNESNVPFLVCDKCDHKVDDWSKWYDTYSKYYLNDDKWESKKDHIVCILGYFANLYKIHYGFDYTFSLNERGLFRGLETTCIRRLYKMFDANAKQTRDYLDWLFKAKVVERKKKITSLGFLATPAIVSEYKMICAKRQQITRATPLPNQLLQWITVKAPELLEQMALKDHGDLHVLLTHYKMGLVNNAATKTLVDKLLNVGYITDAYTIKNWRE